MIYLLSKDMKRSLENTVIEESVALKGINLIGAEYRY